MAKLDGAVGIFALFCSLGPCRDLFMFHFTYETVERLGKWGPCKNCGTFSYATIYICTYLQGQKRSLWHKKGDLFCATLYLCKVLGVWKSGSCAKICINLPPAIYICIVKVKKGHVVHEKVTFFNVPPFIYEWLWESDKVRPVPHSKKNQKILKNWHTFSSRDLLYKSSRSKKVKFFMKRWPFFYMPPFIYAPFLLSVTAQAERSKMLLCAFALCTTSRKSGLLAVSDAMLVGVISPRWKS